MSRRLRVGLALFTSLLALGLVLWFVALPWYARRRLIEEARARGVALEVSGVSIGLRAVAITNARATAADVPGVTLSAGRIEVALDGFAPRSLAIANASIDVDGRVGDVLESARTFLSSRPKADGGTSGLDVVSVENARVEWRRAVSDAAVLHIGDVSGELRGAPLGTQAHLHLASVTLDVGAVSMGPWSATLAREPAKSELEIALARDAKITFVDAGGEHTSSITIPSVTALKDLGLPAPMLQAVHLDQARLSIDASRTEGAGRARATVRSMRLEGYAAPGAAVSAPIELTDVVCEGTPERMEINRGRVKVGPFAGPLRGVVGQSGADLRVDASTETEALSCADALRAQSGGPVVQGLFDMGHALGVDRAVQGSVSVRADFHLTTRALAETKLTFTPTARCELSLLP